MFLSCAVDGVRLAFGMTQRLRITANFAISGDGKITNEVHRPSGWTSEEDHQRLQELRRGADALLVGRRTLMADRMTMRVVNQDWQPLRCVITRGGTLTGDESLFQTEGGDIHLLSEEIPALLHRQDVHWHRGSLGDFLTRLHADFGVNHLHCEGGGNLMQEIIRLQPPDVIHLTWAAHTLFGGEKSPTITGVPASAISLENGERSWGLSASLRYQLREANPSKCGREMFLSYALADQNLPPAQ